RGRSRPLPRARGTPADHTRLGGEICRHAQRAGRQGGRSHHRGGALRGPRDHAVGALGTRPPDDRGPSNEITAAIGARARRRGAASLSALDTNPFREALVEERTRVQAAIQNLHDENPGTLAEDAGEETAYDNHLADTATETYDRELDYTLEENSEHVLADIDA